MTHDWWHWHNNLPRLVDLIACMQCNAQQWVMTNTTTTTNNNNSISNGVVKNSLNDNNEIILESVHNCKVCQQLCRCFLLAVSQQSGWPAEVMATNRQAYRRLVLISKKMKRKKIEMAMASTTTTMTLTFPLWTCRKPAYIK